MDKSTSRKAVSLNSELSRGKETPHSPWQTAPVAKSLAIQNVFLISHLNSSAFCIQMLVLTKPYSATL